MSFRSLRYLRAKPTRISRMMLSAEPTRIGPYNHLEVEPKWQAFWESSDLFEAKRRPNKPKKYILDMFPYPSGAGLHVGHPEGYTATDIMARYYRMNDYDVLHPMGWDAFGLPAEQHAINTGTHPAVTTYQNIATFKRQLKSLGFSYDWKRELATTDENYFRWTQWIFLQLFKSGLAFQSEVSVNWCPALGTVLANEEVINGRSERGNHPVIRQPLRQWVLKITQYADRLERDLESLQWPEGTLTAQKQWIGRSEGAAVRFRHEPTGADIEVFTTRPDTLLGVTYIVLAPEHPLVEQLVSSGQRPAVEAYLRAVQSKSDLERTAVGPEQGKTGVSLGCAVVHPFTREEIPVWIADYVLGNYGTGAVMAVPAHDSRDFQFAKQFNLPMKQVVRPADGSQTELPYLEDGILCNSGEFDGQRSAVARESVIAKLQQSGSGAGQVSYRLRDWVFSRQRYWGEPIPIYFPVEMLTPDMSGSPIDDAPHRIRFDQPIAVDESELPLKLPEMTDFQPGDDPQGCLARAKHWRFFQRDGRWFARETNTMPQWAGSCWYYLRFADPANNESLISMENARDWLPVDLYVGGQEHATLHLLYARFWHKVLHDLGLVDHAEPFNHLVHQGMILGADGEKMSKSRGNVINPDDVVRSHGADVLRLYEMFMGPLEATKPWQTAQLAGVIRFRDRVFNLAAAFVRETAGAGEGREEPPKESAQWNAQENALMREMHKTIKKVTQDIERLSFNTAIAQMMIFTNTLATVINTNNTANNNANNNACISAHLKQEALETLAILLSPFAPHVSEEVFQLLQANRPTHYFDRTVVDSVARRSWPKYQEELTVEALVKVAVQVNGKVRGTIEVSADITQNDAVALAFATIGQLKKSLGVTAEDPDLALVKNTLAERENKLVKKIIYVPGKILNILLV